MLDIANSQILFVVLSMVVAFLISFASTPVVIGIAKKIKAIDVPKDERRVHKRLYESKGGGTNITL